MQTSCPACRTTFRVSQDQLGQRRGLVRCGGCNAVFNAYDTLLPELEDAPAATLPEVRDWSPDDREEIASEMTADVVADSFAEPTEAIAITEFSPLERALPESEPSEPASPQPLPSSDLAPVSADAREEIAQQVVLESSPTLVEPTERPPVAKGPEAFGTLFAPETSEAILLSDLPNRLKVVRQPLVWWKKALYLLAIIVLAVSLLVQLTYFFRAELAAALPATRPALDALCRPLQCTVPLPQQLTRQTIVSSSLEHDAEQKSRVRLGFLLANRTEMTQAWPHIVLTLSDVRESPVAQRAFAPEDYLPRGISPRRGFPAQSEQEAVVELDLGSLVAASFVLDVKYP